jgi:hypothetical protein
LAVRTLEQSSVLYVERFWTKRRLMESDELIMHLRTATVADKAESLYQLMSDAADEIERLRNLSIELVMLGAINELDINSEEKQ